MLYVSTVLIECSQEEEAKEVLRERLGHDGDYGFPYTLEWTPATNAVAGVFVADRNDG